MIENKEIEQIFKKHDLNPGKITSAGIEVKDDFGIVIKIIKIKSKADLENQLKNLMNMVSFTLTLVTCN